MNSEKMLYRSISRWYTFWRAIWIGALMLLMVSNYGSAINSNTVAVSQEESIFSQENPSAGAVTGNVPAANELHPWWDITRRFRLPVTVEAAGFQRVDKIAEISLNFTQILSELGQKGTFDEDSIRVVEIDDLGTIIDSSVSFQFDRDEDFDATTKASGNIVFIMDGITQASANRYYHIYFDLTGGYYSPLVVEPLVTVIEEIDELQLSYRIDAVGSTYYFQKEAGGFSSLVDASGNDWIGYSAASGSAGAYRGIPNAVYPEGYFHPGSTCCTSTVVAQGPVKVTIRSVSNDGTWESAWDIYPSYATMTMVKANNNYWMLYEGTPGGIFEPDTDFMYRSDGNLAMLNQSRYDDIVDNEWAYFSDPTIERSLFLAHHEDDTLIDMYRPMENNMTVFGFGRNELSKLISSVPQHFTIGLVDGTDISENSKKIYSAYKDLIITKGYAEYFDVSPPIIVTQPENQTVEVGRSASFNVSAAGKLPLFYQWQKNGMNITGATDANYDTPPTTVADNGSKFQVIVTNSDGIIASNQATLTVTPSSSDQQLILLDVAHDHSISTMAFSFFDIPSGIPNNLVSPVDYANGTLYQRLQVLDKPSKKTVTYQLCLFQDYIVPEKHACTDESLLTFTSRGTYYPKQSMKSLYQYGNISWNRSLLKEMLVVKDKNGIPVDNRYGWDGLWDGSPDFDLYYPMKVRYTAIIVPQGGGKPRWPSDNPEPATIYIPPVPVIANVTKGNFWINYTLQPEAGNVTDSYNVSVNDIWTNGTISTYHNISVGPHGWSNITVYAYNNSGSGSLSLTAASQNTQVSNNIPVLAPIGDRVVISGDLLTFLVSAGDEDFDTITYSTDAAMGTLNPSTGVYSWTPGNGDAGTYFWTFSSNDNYGGVSSETITVTVNAVPAYIPQAPTNLISTRGNFWINNTWQAGEGNLTDSYNFSVNGIWINGTSGTYHNISAGPHGWSNITVYAYNNSGSGSLSLTAASQNTQVSNNIPVLAPIGDKVVTSGDLLTFAVSAGDVDFDEITYSTDAAMGTLNPSTGIYSWTPGNGDAGTYFWTFSSNDNYGGVSSETITVMVSAIHAYIPQAPTNLISTRGNFWINNTWQAGEGNITDSYNVSANGTWTNGTKNTNHNISVGPHGWSNITVYAYNNSGGGSLSLTAASQNTQVSNNIPVLAPIGDKVVTSGDLLTFAVSAGDVDFDMITYSTNATMGTLNPSTGIYSWTPGNGDAGTYFWTFSSNDNYGGVSSETIIVTVIPNSSNYITVNINNNTNIYISIGNSSIIIFKGTNATASDGTYLKYITVNSIKQVNTTLTSGDIFLGENLRLGPEGARFAPDIQLRFNYTDEQLAAKGISASQLRVKFYNTTTFTWVELAPYHLYRNGTEGYIIVNVSHFSTFALIGVPAPTNNNKDGGGDSSSNSGGGGGGGGGASGENYYNIELRDRKDLYIYKDKVTQYSILDQRNPIMFVNITGNVNSGEITAIVEVLRNSSSLVKTPAPGIVYKNINIWIGTSGFSSPKNIKSAVIRIRVNNSWLASNNIKEAKMVKWDRKEWVQLDTEEKNKDSEYTYYEAKTDTFSHFSIIGLKDIPRQTTTSSIMIPSTGNDIGNETPVVSVTKEKTFDAFNNLILLIGFFWVVGIIIEIYNRIKKK